MKFTLQTGVQLPPLQVTPEAFGSVVEHTLLQVPQLFVSVASLTHVLPQRVVGDVQVVAQCPMPLHVWPIEQTLPHAPQLSLSFCSLTHTPLQRT